MVAEERADNSSRRVAGILLNLFGWVGSAFFLILICRQAGIVDWSVISIDWNNFILAFLLLMIGQALQSQLAWITQHALGYPIAHFSIYRVWFFSQVAKYIPGSLWQIAARTAFYFRRGVPLGTASAATLWELIATITGSLIVCLFSFALRPEAYFLSLGALGLIILALFSFMDWPWRLLVFFRMRPAARVIDALTQLEKPRYFMLVGLFSLSLAVWMIIGTGFFFLVRAFNLNGQLTWWNAVISFNVAYSIGFLVIVAPTGLGVREIILLLLLSPYFEASSLAVFVVVARLWWIAAEGINICIAGIGQLIGRQTASVKIIGRE
jgi:glycosyltransferase 2 family protein